MFAAGRTAAASGSQGGNHDDRRADSNGGNCPKAQLDDDWLQIGKSFSGGTNTDTANANSSLQVYKHRRSKHRHEEKKKKGKRSEEESLTKFDSKHKRKSKHKKRHRERDYSNSSDSDEKYHSHRHSRRHRHRSRSRSRSRSRRGEMRIVKQPAKEIQSYEQEPADGTDKLFETDCRGDRDNQLYGSMYAHDQPLYDLATRRNLLTGAWISSSRPKYNSAAFEKKKDEGGTNRYFSLQARRMERDARQKRLYLAYSEKRLARAGTSKKGGILDFGRGLLTMKIAERPTEMEFVPLDPVVDVEALVGDMVQRESGGRDRGDDTLTSNDVAEGVMLTDTQSVEQHLVARTKMFNTALAANPHNIDMWLDFVAFQEETLRLQTKNKKLSPSLKTNVEEKQAAILDRALDSNPQSRALHRVKLNMLLRARTNGKKADFDSIQRQLEDLLSQDATNSDLWLKLLQNRQQHFGSFSMQSVRDLYARILNVLRSESEHTSKVSVENELSTTRVQELLLDFHFLMCTFELKAGYVERSIVQLQALIDFSLNEPSRGVENDDRPNYLEMLCSFASRWDEVGTVGFGDATLDVNGNYGGNTPFQPSMASYEKYIQDSCITPLDQMNPPEILRATAHKKRLLSGSAAYQRKANMNMTASGGENSADLGINAYGSASSDAEELDSRRSGKLVYSNLHGYRISVDDADDTREYERILGELRGTESAQARQIQLLEKDNRRRKALATALSLVEDQRSNYPSIEGNDRFVKWLTYEEKQSQMQWAPLRSSNPLHQELIEKHPDRATLTEEIQPFLFSVPKKYLWRLIAELLQICGVEWRGEYAWDGIQQVRNVMYADNASDYELLVSPILAALDAHAKNHSLMLSPWDRKLLLERALLVDVEVRGSALYNPSKVTFIRRIFEQALSVCDATDGSQGHDFLTTFKCLWIGFEAEVARGSTSKESSLVYARQLCQRLSQTTRNNDTDFDALYAYAKLELRLGDERQVRRICDNTLVSISSPSSSKSSQRKIFHRFVFLRARLEMWPSAPAQKSSNARFEERFRTLRCLYTLWHAWQLGQDDNKLENLDTVTKKHRKRTQEVLQGRLMSDPSIEASLLAKCRADLGLAIQECGECCKERRRTGKPEFKATCWASYCLHNLALVVYTYQGFDAACMEYRQALNDPDHCHCPNLEWMWVCFLEFMQQHQASGRSAVLAPKVWRLAVGKAVDLFPGRALFLRLFADSETSNTISQVLRNYFLRVEKRWRRHYDSPELVEWLFALLCELYRVERAAALLDAEQPNANNSVRLTCCLFHYWGTNATAVGRIRRVFESMVDNVRTKGNALCWRLYLRFEVALGKVDAAKKVFYRGIAACAWSKELYMDGIRVLRAYLSDDECLELYEFMEAKEIHMRVDFDVGE